MNKIKSVLSVALIPLIVTSIATGCVRHNVPVPVSSAATSSNAKISGTITVWVGDTAQSMFTTLGSEFTKQTGVQVKFVPYTGLSATDKLALDGPAGKGGDVYMQGDGGALGKAVTQGLFMELPKDKMDLSRFTPGAYDGYVVNGKLYGLPMGEEAPALLYNKKLISSIPDTWDAFIDQTKKLSDIMNDKYGFLMDVTNPYFTMPFFDADGGYVFKNNNGVYDTNDIGLANTGSVQAFTMLTSYINTLVPKNMTFEVMQKKFSDGKCAVIFDGPWSVNNYTKAGIDLGVAALPKLSNGNYPRVYSGSYGVCVSAFTKNPNAAVAFVDFVTKKEGDMAYFNLTKRIPPLKECQTLPEIKDDPIIQGFAAQLLHSVPQPNIAEMDSMWAPMQDAAALVITQNKPIDSTLKSAVEKMKEDIATMHK